MGSPESGTGRRYDLKDYANSSHSGLLADVFDNRLEQTLGGCTLGVVRDTVSKPDSLHEKIKRAEQNDLAAHVAGDTLAVVPRFRALTAGTVRAGLLINPHKNVQENLPSFALNMGEGVMLNNVGKMMLPGSRTQSIIAGNFKSKIGREIATHLTVGAGFGGVKTGFDLKNWTDDQGNFTPGKLSLKMAQGMGTGASINVPAGMVGMRVMRGSINLMGGESQVASNRLAMGLAGAGSGYTSGALFGGIDAVTHGKSFDKTLEQMHFSGKVGAFTGGFLGATDNGALHRRYKELAKLLSEPEPVTSAVKPQEEAMLVKDAPKPLKKGQQAHASDTHKDRRVFEDELVYESDSRPPRTKPADSAPMDFQPLDGYKVREISPRLRNPTTENMTVRVLKKDAKQTFDSFDDFMAQTEEKQVKVRVYEVEGHSAKLVVEESLAQKQDAARSERATLEMVSEKKIPYDNLPREARLKITLATSPSDILSALQKYLPHEAAAQCLPVLQARKQLVLSSAMKVPLPEDFVVLMDGVPNRGKINTVVLSENPNPQDPWWRQEYKQPGFASGASASGENVITFYLTKQQPQSRTTLRFLMGHEFGHLVDNNAPAIQALYPLAALVDKDVPNPNYRSKSSTVASEPPPQPTEGPMSADRKMCKYFAREYATKNHHEDAAVHQGENVMASNSARLVRLGENAPVRTVLLARSLAKTLAEAAPGQESPHNKELQQRLGWVENDVLPEALRILENRLKYGTSSEQAAAAELLGYLGNKTRHTPMLRKVASNPGSDVVPVQAPEASGVPYLSDGKKPGLVLSPEHQPGTTDHKARTLADIAFDAMLRLHEGNIHDQLLLLSAEANRTSPTKGLANNRLGRVQDVDAAPYRRYAELKGDPNNLPELIKVLGKMSDPGSQLEVFNECYRLAGGDRAKIKSVVAMGLQKIGSRSEAIERVRPEDVADVKPTLERLAKQSWDKPLQEKARILLDGKPDPVVVATKLIGSDTASDVLRGIDMLEAAKSRDMRAVEPLLIAMATGPDAARTAARQALSKFNLQTIKFYAGVLKNRGIEIKPSELTSIVDRP